VEVPYERLGPVKRLVHPPEVELVAETYGERVRLVLSVREDRRDEVVAALADLGVGSGRL
jgi:putative IMPACT (imprinted ancient) family translation regulator